ncbi:hypothetical protein Trydic_g5860 [Trypoxylus dichotomus]
MYRPCISILQTDVLRRGLLYASEDPSNIHRLIRAKSAGSSLIPGRVDVGRVFGRVWIRIVLVRTRRHRRRPLIIRFTLLRASVEQLLSHQSPPSLSSTIFLYSGVLYSSGGTYGTDGIEGF